MNIVAELDSVAETSLENAIAANLDRLVFLSVLLMVVAAPHSIAATQTGWLLGMTAWVARIFVKPRLRVRVPMIGGWLIALFVWSAISSMFSYEPIISIDKLRGVAVFLIFFLVFNVVRNRRAVYLLAFVLISSCMVSVAWTPVQKLIGRGVELGELRPDGPLTAKGVKKGDVIVRANEQRVASPEDVLERFDGRESVSLELNRLDGVYRIELSKQELLGGQSAPERLGFTDWRRGRGFRAAGFYGHYTTFAEVLQLIGALALGFLVAGLRRGIPYQKAIALGLSLLGIGFALLLTVTRASQLAFLISSGTTVLLGGSRRFALVAAAVAIVMGGSGLFVLQHERQVGFFDRNDESIKWRQMMWRDGVRLLCEEPRHLITGVGMDSIKNRWMEWGLFDKGWQPMGHFHSTPLQLVVERGIPALLIWLVVLGVYARTLWRGLRRQKEDDWRAKGVFLGCLGGLIGFFASGIVHYNLGDQEVAMVFYILMGLGISLAEMQSAEELLDGDSLLLAPSA